MSLVAGKCPYCGNTIDCDSGHLFGVCPHCETTYNTQNAISIVNLSLENSEQLKSDRESLRKALEENDFNRIKSVCRSIIHVIGCDFLANYYHSYASKERNNPFYYVDFLKNMDNEIGTKEEQDEVLAHMIAHSTLLDGSLIEDYIDRTIDNQGEYIGWIKKLKKHQEDIRRENGFKLIRRECFICYAPLDEDVAYEIASVLEDVNIKCFLSARNIDKEKESDSAVEDAISVCRMVILVASNRALSAYNIKDEMIFAMNKGLKFIEFKIDESQSDISFKHTIPADNRIETHRRRGEYYSILINMVRKELTMNNDLKTRYMDAINVEKDELEKIRLSEPVIEKVTKKVVTMDENLANVVSLVDENELDRANALVDELIENYPADYRSYLSKVRILTRNFTEIDDTSHKVFLKQAYSVASPDQTEDIDDLYSDYLAYRFQELVENYKPNVDFYDDSVEEIDKILNEYNYYSNQTKEKIEKEVVDKLYQAKSDLEEAFMRKRDEQKYTDFSKKTFFEVKGDVLLKYTGRNAMVQIPDGIKVIGEGCFQGLKSLKTIAIPYGIEVIKDSAFSDCSNLESIDLPETLVELGDDAFSACSILREVTLPLGVTRIGYRTFYNCSNLGIVHMGEEVTEISGLAFSNCQSLYQINMPQSIKSIGRSAFSYCTSLQNIVLPNDVLKLEGETFYHATRLDNITLPENLEEISDEVFSGCTRLLKVSFPDKLKRIGKRAFQECKKLRTVIIPKGCLEIEEAAFYQCTDIKELKFQDGCLLTDLGREAFAEDENIRELDLPKGIKVIEEKTFYNLKKCEKVVLPTELERLEPLSLYGMETLATLLIPSKCVFIGDKALYGCNRLNTVYFANKDTFKEFNKVKKQQFYNFTCEVDK